jgi:hypothetical protein
MTIAELNQQLNQQAINFTTTMQVIDSNYNFNPVKFTNGEVVNEENTNNGSCKIFAYGKLHNLPEQATLNAFGDYYVIDVLQHPDADNHANIRNFIKTGWQGVQFFGEALQLKNR